MAALLASLWRGVLRSIEMPEPTCCPYPNSLPLALEVRCNVGHPAMVDIRIGACKPPNLWVPIKGLLHVFMDQHLHIHSHFPQSPHDYVTAHSPIKRHISTWIGEFHVVWIVDRGLADLVGGCGGQAFRRALLLNRPRLLRDGWS